MTSLIPNFGLAQSSMVIVVALAIVYAASTVVLQRKLSNAKRMREINAKIQKVTKEMNQMVKNKAPEAEIAARQKEIMPLLHESMKSSLKPMFVVLPIFLVVYYLLLPMLPFAAAANNTKGVQGLFFIVVFITGMVLAITMMIHDRKMTKLEEAASAQNATIQTESR
jgi:uncharacterized membrane protein (DUF106 family)